MEYGMFMIVIMIDFVGTVFDYIPAVLAVSVMSVNPEPRFLKNIARGLF